MTDRERAALSDALETAMPHLIELTQNAKRPLDDLFAVLVADENEVTCLVCETARQKDFIEALPDDPKLREEIRDVTSVPASGLLRVVVALGRRGQDVTYGRVRIQIHDGDYA